VGKAYVQGTIPARAGKTLKVPLRINCIKLINAVKGARAGAVIPYKADMGLSVNVPIMGQFRMRERTARRKATRRNRYNPAPLCGGACQLPMLIPPTPQQAPSARR